MEKQQITKKLREYADELTDIWSDDRERLNSIADEIDMEYEYNCTASRMRENGVLTGVGNEESLAERGWMPIPVGADKKPLKINDEVCGYSFQDGKVYVLAIVDKNQILVGKPHWHHSNWQLWQADATRHYVKPTIKELLEQFGNAWESGQITDGDRQGSIEKDSLLNLFASKLRLADDIK